MTTLRPVRVYQETDPFMGLIWADDTDATYSVQYGDGGPPDTAYPDYTGSVFDPYAAPAPSSAVLRVRISATRTDPTDPVRAQFDVYDTTIPGPFGGIGVNTWSYSTPDFDILADGVTRELDVPIPTDELVGLRAALTGATPSSVVSVELYFDHYGGSSEDPIDRVITVYELSLILGTTEEPTYRRIYPRDDGLSGGAARNYPPSKSVQNGNRTHGGYL